MFLLFKVAVLDDGSAALDDHLMDFTVASMHATKQTTIDIHTKPTIFRGLCFMLHENLDVSKPKRSRKRQ